MSKQIFADYTQSMLLPVCVEDWVGPDHPARFVRDFVSQLPLCELGFRPPVVEPGRPGYCAEMLLCVWLYGYLEKIRSSRKLEHACRTHFALVWLTGMHCPDHNTLWRFWRDHRKQMKAVFAQSVLVAKELGLLGMVAQAVDGTKIAVSSADAGAFHEEKLSRLHEAISESIAKMESEVETHAQINDAPEALPEALQEAKARLLAIEQALAVLSEQGAGHVIESEPDARMMTSRGLTAFAYNAQAVVDAAVGIIVAQEVCNEATDVHQLLPMAQQAASNTGAAAQCIVADAGYRNAAQEIEVSGLGFGAVLLPEHGREADNGDPYHKSRFHYDAENDCYLCPQGQTLPYQYTRNRQDRPPERVYHCPCYKQCPVRMQCSKAHGGRTIVQHPLHAHQKAQREQRARPEMQALLNRRKAIIEPLFGWIKHNHGFRRWSARGLVNAKAQWAVLCLTINLAKIYNRWKQNPTLKQPPTRGPKPGPAPKRANRRTDAVLSAHDLHQRLKRRSVRLAA